MKIMPDVRLRIIVCYNQVFCRSEIRQKHELFTVSFL